LAIQLQCGKIVPFDGNWNHRRSAKDCILVLIDLPRRQIGAVETILESMTRQAKNNERSGNGQKMELTVTLQTLRMFIILTFMRIC
jgi:hypothetical protein